MGQPKTDAELVVELIEQAEAMHETIQQVREVVNNAITRYCAIGHPVDRAVMSKLLGNLSAITEEYAE